EPDGTETVISRDKSTAHLTQYLRAYGGSGKYQGKRIGRRLKNVTYSGVGLVRRPANPESIILTDEVSNASENLNMETYEMADELKSQLAEANETIKSLRQRLEEVNEKQVKEKVEAFENKITALENSVASLTEKLDDANKTIKSLSEKVTATETAKADVEKKLAEVEAKARTEARVSTLIAAGKDEKEARELADSFAKLDDEAFKSVAAVIEQSLKAIKEAAKPDPETDTAEANVDDLETAEAVKTNLNANDVDETDAEKALA